MKLRRNPHLRLVRWPDALLPAALLAAACTGPARAELALVLFGAALAVRTLSLGSAYGLRAAFARQPSFKQVRGSALLALLLQLVAAAMIAGLAYRLRARHLAAPLMLAGIGLSLNIEQTFYEYLYAIGDRQSAAVCRLITAGLTLAGMMMVPRAYAYQADTFPGYLRWPLVMAVLSAGAATVVGSAMDGGLKGRLNAQVLRCAPRALLQVLLYPAAAMAYHTRVVGLLPELPELTAPAFFAGLILCEVCRTPFRRSGMEARPLNRALFAVALLSAGLGAALIFAPWPALIPWAPLREALRLVPAFCAALLIAALCAFALYGSPGRAGSQ